VYFRNHKSRKNISGAKAFNSYIVFFENRQLGNVAKLIWDYLSNKLTIPCEKNYPWLYIN